MLIVDFFFSWYSFSISHDSQKKCPIRSHLMVPNLIQNMGLANLRNITTGTAQIAFMYVLK